MSHFGDFIGGKETVVTPITTPQPVVEKPVRPEEKIVMRVLLKSITKQDLMKLSKIELEEFGREHGIELDRRLTHAKLVVQLKAFIDSKS
ncbi:MAG: hypothetical protein CM15mV14_0530 [uncultured marine virus]|nr:MAG: hypothetical protein CM15mV14_0530 [uncultured marine virus]